MGYYHRWEEFPEQSAYYLKDNPDCQGIRSRRISGDRIMASRVLVKGGSKIPHYHEAEQMMFIFKGKAHVSTGDEPVRTLGPGDIWVVPSNVAHGVEYEGDLEAIEVVSPARGGCPGRVCIAAALRKTRSKRREKRWAGFSFPPTCGSWESILVHQYGGKPRAIWGNRNRKTAPTTMLMRKGRTPR